VAKSKTKGKTTSEAAETRSLVSSAFDVARSLGINKVVVQADELQDIRIVAKLRESEQLIWLTRGGEDLPLLTDSKDPVLRLPETSLTRMSQLKVGLLIAVMNNHVSLDLNQAKLFRFSRLFREHCNSA